LYAGLYDHVYHLKEVWDEFCSNGGLKCCVLTVISVFLNSVLLHLVYLDVKLRALLHQCGQDYT